MKVLLSIVLVLMTLMTFSSCSADAPSAEPPFFFRVTRVNEEGMVIRGGFSGYLSFGFDNYLSPIYSKVSPFSVNGLALVCIDEAYHVIDTKGKMVCDLPYTECQFISAQYDCYRVCEKDKWGVVNAKGKIVIPVEYDEILDNGVNIVAAVKGDTTTVFDLTGKQLAEIPYRASGFLRDLLLLIEKDSSDEYEFQYDSYDTRAEVGVADVNGTILIAPNPNYVIEYDSESEYGYINDRHRGYLFDYYNEGEVEYIAFERVEDKPADQYDATYDYYYVNGTSVTLTCEGENLRPYRQLAGSWLMFYDDTIKKFVVCYRGTRIAEFSDYYFPEISCVYDDNDEVIDDLLVLNSPLSGSAMWSDGTTRIQADQAALMDSSGHFLIEPGLYDYIMPYLSNGYLQVRQGYIFDEDDGRYGVINLQGDVIVECVYEDENDDVFDPYLATNCYYLVGEGAIGVNPYLVDGTGKKVPGMEGETLFSFEYQNETYYFLQREFGSVMEIFNENLEVVASYQPTDPIRVFLPKTWG